MIENFNIKKYSEQELFELGTWYTLQVYAQSELAVKKNIHSTLTEYGLLDSVEVVLVPTEDIIYIKNKKEVSVEKAIYSGYVFICIKGELDKNLMFLISRISKVSHFIEYDNEPVKISFLDLKKIMEKVINKKAARLRNNFELGDRVKIEEGPFVNFNGIVKRFNPIDGLLEIDVSIFGRDTQVELHFKNVSIIKD